jgi:hypothetical protein
MHAACKVVVVCLFFACNLLPELWCLLQRGCDVSLADQWPVLSRIPARFGAPPPSGAAVPAPLSFLLPLSYGFFILTVIFELPQRFLFGLEDEPVEKERVEIFSDVSVGDPGPPLALLASFFRSSSVSISMWLWCDGIAQPLN